MICTTLAAIPRRYLAKSSWRKLLAHLGKRRADDACLPFHVIVSACGIDAALTVIRFAPRYRGVWRLYAVWCARRVQHLMTDPRSIAALDTAERYAEGKATRNELNAARNAAWAAADAVASATGTGAEWNVAIAAAFAASPGRGWVCAGLVAQRVRGAASTSTWDAERDAQTAEFLRVVGEEELREARGMPAKQRS
jgi:hypothetical protein